MFDYGNPDSSAQDLARTIDELVSDLSAPLPARDHGYSYVKPFRTVEPKSSLLDAPDKEWSREEWLDWYEEEFAGYATDEDPDSFVEDDAGEDREAGDEPILVSQWQLASDISTVAHLDRDERTCYRHSPDGSRSVKGEHPFSKDEGAAEWLARVRIELRDAYRRAGSDRERSAIVAREAALRARHNARCYARAIVRYRNLDEGLALKLVDGWQRDFPIGWLGIERDLREMLADCTLDFEAAHAAWDAEFDGKWSQAQKDEWLDRMPVAPEHPTQLVTSVKKLRSEPVKNVRVREEFPMHTTRIVDGRAVTSTTIRVASRLADVRYSTREQTTDAIGAPALAKDVRERLHRERLLQHRAVLLAKLDALKHAPRISRGNVRRWQRAAEHTTEWYSLRKEWERGECVEPVRGSTPENLPAMNRHGELEREFGKIADRLAQYHVDRVLREACATRYLSTAA